LFETGIFPEDSGRKYTQKQTLTRADGGSMADPDKTDPDEREVFRAAVRDVRPLRTERRGSPPPPSPETLRRRRASAAARFARAERAAVLAESLRPPARDADVETGEELSYRRDGVQEGVLRKLRRGQFRIDADIDLHGLTAAEGERALREFLAAAIARGAGCVRIVHGKGLRSGNRGPVLKNMVNRLLPRLDAVIAFSGARQVDGGSGATLVLLSRSA
jgi:DNA-nicking Smr family endonuclease